MRQVSATTSIATGTSALLLMEQVVEQSNMQRAWSRVKSNKGSAGVDGLTIGQTAVKLKEDWPAIRQALLEGRYRPEPVRRVAIPKPKGGTRQLGIPTVTDRLIQQAIHQVLEPLFDREFSDSSFGFRPGRSAHMAVQQSRRYCDQGCRWVVDMDLEKFFDRVNHDILMSRVARKVRDKRLLVSFSQPTIVPISDINHSATKDGVKSRKAGRQLLKVDRQSAIDDVILTKVDRQLTKHDRESFKVDRELTKVDRELTIFDPLSITENTF